MTNFDLDTKAVERVVTAAMGRDLEYVDAIALGESSRATPWRVEFESTDGPVLVLLRHGESVSRNEVAALRAMQDLSIPTPRVLLWDDAGELLGTPLFVSELIEGAPLLPLMIAGEEWASDLYVETACALQAIQADELPAETVKQLEGTQSVRDLIEGAYQRFAKPEPLHRDAYRRLLDTMPDVPEPAFSNGDLWPENLLVRERRLVGVIDWQHAGWTDPLFEFLLPFFLVPELRNRGIEERFCRRKGYDPGVLNWYHGVEFFDSLSIVLKIGRPYEMHTAESLTRDLELWLASN